MANLLLTVLYTYDYISVCLYLPIENTDACFSALLYTCRLTLYTGAVDYGGCEYGECDYGGFYGECDYGECEYGGCDYGECEYGGCDYGECVSVRVWPMGYGMGYSKG